MKTKYILLALLLSILSVNMLTAQVITAPVEIGQGFKFKDFHNPQWYLLTVAVKPSAAILNDKVTVSTPGMSMYCDGEVDLFGGTEIAGKVYESGDKQFNVQLVGSALFGSGGKQLYGGGAKLEFGKLVYIALNARQEYQYKELYFDGALGINLINF